MTVDDADALDFFNELSIRLDIELDPPAQQAASHLLNLVASPGARVKSVIARALVVDEDDDRALTEDEAARVVLRAPSIRLGSLDAEGSVEHRAPDGETFTVHDLLGAIAETERQLRAETNWMGGIDVHHIYFEGLEETPEGVWVCAWGS